MKLFRGYTLIRYNNNTKTNFTTNNNNQIRDITANTSSLRACHR